MEERIQTAEVSSSLRAFDELRRLERRVSMEPHRGDGGVDRAGHEKLSNVVLHTAPFVIPCAVKLLWDGANNFWSGLKGTTDFTIVLQIAIGVLAICALLWATRTRHHHLSESSGNSVRVKVGPVENKQVRLIGRRIGLIVRVLFGRENMKRAHDRLRSLDDCSEMLSWICEVVGVEAGVRSTSEDNVEMLDKIEELENMVGIQT
eukprot:CAMPEP_0198240486 /NCGR_PEP_ID=MMETSP1446-20131203/5583_1 /TAXON_ID=1461542 ORGANISM="Unidentified sp, Strain CCMP2111" /NCGR_SAMPLE_ID=MMETSP1446 /ASSEMBLY_ACC=CAM_ASM_001112 /LENGTH=204 /DNA_ID=CAMNT_0043923219 /DNA_START=52 /DNA_END=666 /DNA_ORIENTATION=+